MFADIQQILYIKQNVHFLFKSMLRILFLPSQSNPVSIFKLTLKRSVNINALGVVVTYSRGVPVALS